MRVDEVWLPVPVNVGLEQASTLAAKCPKTKSLNLGIPSVKSVYGNPIFHLKRRLKVVTKYIATYPKGPKTSEVWKDNTGLDPLAHKSLRLLLEENSSGWGVMHRIPGRKNQNMHI
jgi:hypothetical protein